MYYMYVCSSNSTCERIDGNCTNGCIGGYSGYQCQLRGMSILETLTFPEHMSSPRFLVGFVLFNLYFQGENYISTLCRKVFELISQPSNHQFSVFRFNRTSYPANNIAYPRHAKLTTGCL
jgi:hypothetical protein